MIETPSREASAAPPSARIGAASGSDLAVLVCRIRGLLAAIPIEHVAETMRPLAVQPLSAMPAFVRGVAMIRGAPVPVVDAGVLITGQGNAEIRRFVLVRAGGRPVALAVEGVLGVRGLPFECIQDLPPLLRALDCELTSAVGTLDAQLLIVLRGVRILPDAVWEALAAQDPG